MRSISRCFYSVSSLLTLLCFLTVFTPVVQSAEMVTVKTPIPTAKVSESSPSGERLAVGTDGNLYRISALSQPQLVTRGDSLGGGIFLAEGLTPFFSGNTQPQSLALGEASRYYAIVNFGPAGARIPGLVKIEAGVIRRIAEYGKPYTARDLQGQEKKGFFVFISAIQDKSRRIFVSATTTPQDPRVSQRMTRTYFELRGEELVWITDFPNPETYGPYCATEKYLWYGSNSTQPSLPLDVNRIEIATGKIETVIRDVATPGFFCGTNYAIGIVSRGGKQEVYSYSDDKNASTVSVPASLDGLQIMDLKSATVLTSGVYFIAGLSDGGQALISVRENEPARVLLTSAEIGLPLYWLIGGSSLALRTGTQAIALDTHFLLQPAIPPATVTFAETVSFPCSGIISGARARFNDSSIDTEVLATGNTCSMKLPLGVEAGTHRMTTMVKGSFGETVTVSTELTITPITPDTTPATEPVITAVVSNGGYQPGIAPHGWAVIFGTFTGVSKTSVPGNTLTNKLGNVRVIIAGQPALLIYVSSDQINFLVPPNVLGSAEVRVEVNGRMSRPFTSNSSPETRLLITDNGIPVAQNSSWQNTGTPNNPAQRGETIVLYGTGCKTLRQNATPYGKPAGSEPLEHCEIPVVTIGGQTAEVMFAGLTPGLVGVTQLNLKIPGVPSMASPEWVTGETGGQTFQIVLQ